jgi:predicted short-subunit dehydrogenase-like oxidoreductase (DUF2520 family)
MKIGFIGAGKVGVTLGKYFKSKGITVTGFYSRNAENAKAAANFTSTNYFETLERIVKSSDTLFLTVTDSCISEVYASLSKKDIKGKLICHCSGALSAKEVFCNAENAGISICSVHPLLAISDKYMSYGIMEGGFFTIEGSPLGVEKISQLLNFCKNPLTVIKAENKNLYHCSAAIASNLVNGLIDISLGMLTKCGFTREKALQAIAPIITSNILNIAENDTILSLTGPVERCDLNTVKKHLLCFTDEKEKEIYRLISEKLVTIAEQKHPERDYSVLKATLEGENNEEK